MSTAEQDRWVVWLRNLAAAVAVSLSLFQIYTAVFGVFRTAIVHRATHLGFVLALFFLLRAAGWVDPAAAAAGMGRGWRRFRLLLDLGLAIAGAWASVHVVLNYREAAERFGVLTLPDIILGILLLLAVIEATRRLNLPFAIVTVLALLYIPAGRWVDFLGHPGMGYERMLYMLYLSTEGLFGTALGVASTYLFLYILLGAFLERTGAGDMLIQVALGLVGRFRGGPAKTSVVASALLGSVVGSSIANVVTTGTFTIPLMKRSGFRPHQAAAIEAVSSSGGQLLPPVMGTGAFLMAEFTGIPYGTIALAALIPALLYFLSVYAVVHFEACKLGLVGLRPEEVPVVRRILARSGHLAIPLLVLVYLLLVQGTTATLAGVVAIGTLLVLAQLHPASRLSGRDLLGVLQRGAQATLEVSVMCAAIGIIIGAVVLTGIALKFTALVLGLTGGQLLLTLVLVMAAALILGTGLPTPVAYLLLAMFAAPVLEKVGVPVLAAHLFVFYFAIKSGVTPPVAVTAVVAAGVAGSPWVRTGVTSFLYSLAGFIIAYMFVYGPQLLLQGSALGIALATASAAVGVVTVAGATQGWFLGPVPALQRVLLLGSALLLIKPGLMTDLPGFALLGVVLALQWRSRPAAGGTAAAGAGAAPRG